MLLSRAVKEGDRFNPYYGLVVQDPGEDLTDRLVTVLWEDGRERKHERKDVVAWKDLPQEIRK